MIWFILAGLVVLAFVVKCVLDRDFFGAAYYGLMTSIVMFFIACFLNLLAANESPYTIQERTYELKSIKDVSSTSSEGIFFIAVGGYSSDEKMKFRFYREESGGGFVLDEANPYDVVIHETDSGKPRMVAPYAVAYSESNFWSVWALGTPDERPKKHFYVPAGSILEEYELDAS